MSFTLLTPPESLRLGTLQTTHGLIETPNFMPVGTKATVKGIDVERLRESGAQITLVNTYHLWLRPGPERIQKLGGIQKFSGWHGPILSDSGGYQVFSLKGMRKLSEEGVEFQSHLDGSKQFLSPEKAVWIQETLGVDIAMVLDECPSPGQPIEDLKRSLDMTHRWAARCLAARAHPDKTQLFGITQGGGHRSLRTESAQILSEMPFNGMAIGGLSVGEPKEVMYDVLSYHPSQLPANKVRYLMGVGTPEDIVTAVKFGVDIFDCVMPTRSGRFGRAFIRGEEPFINIRNTKFALDDTPLDPTCHCVACRNYSKAYLHHLFKVDEMLGPQMLSAHNIYHYLQLMRDVRAAIKAGTFEELYQRIKATWASTIHCSKSNITV
jgi:queuine tRNA-ribosyltransferase